MTRNQFGWFLFIVGLLVIVALIVGDLVTLFQSHSSMDMAFVTGMLSHVLAVVTAFGGGYLIRPKDDNTVSEQKRADLSQGAGV